MSAAEIIEQIKALPPAEKAEVVDFVRALAASPREIKFATAERAKEAGDRAVKQYEPVFRALSRSDRETAAGKIFSSYDELFKKLAE